MHACLSVPLAEPTSSSWGHSWRTCHSPPRVASAIWVADTCLLQTQPFNPSPGARLLSPGILRPLVEWHGRGNPEEGGATKWKGPRSTVWSLVHAAPTVGDSPQGEIDLSVPSHWDLGIFVTAVDLPWPIHQMVFHRTFYSVTFLF